MTLSDFTIGYPLLGDVPPSCKKCGRKTGQGLDQCSLRLCGLAATGVEAEAKHRLVLLEKELLQDRLGKKCGASGDRSNDRS